MQVSSLVRVTGFEPTASWTRTKRDTKLRHTRIFHNIIRKCFWNVKVFPKYIPDLRGIEIGQTNRKGEGRMAAKKGKREPLAPGEKRRLRQMAVCLVLFGIVFVGRGVDLEPVVRLSDQVAQLVRQDTDFQAVFAQVGQTVARGEEWLKELAGEDGQTP